MINYRPQKRTSTTIDNDDWVYMKKHNIKIAHAIRAFVRDHRVNTNDPDANPSVRDMRKNMDKFREMFEELRDFLENKGLLEEFWKKKNG